MTYRRRPFAFGIDPTAVSSRGLGHSPLKAGTRVRIPLPLLLVVLYGNLSAQLWPHRLSVRTGPFQGPETGSTPVGAMAPRRESGSAGDGACAGVR